MDLGPSGFLSSVSYYEEGCRNPQPNCHRSIRGILDYRQKRIAELPAWLDEFKFATEEKLGSEIEVLQKQIADQEGQIQVWKDYKAILSTSGDVLKDRVVSILRGLFGLKVDAPEEYREDAKILDDPDSVLAFVEIKGTKSGIKREHINQVDSHRERASLASTVPGVLVINNEMSIAGIKDRFKTTVPGEQIDHAKKLNVLIIRTIDLLFLIRQFEDLSDKKKVLRNYRIGRRMAASYSDRLSGCFLRLTKR